MCFSPAQCRAARGLLAWTAEDLAKASKVSSKTIMKYEGGTYTPKPLALEALQNAFKANGVIFLAGEKCDFQDGVALVRGTVDQKALKKSLPDPITPDEERLGFIAHWREKRDLWDDITDDLKRQYLAMMGLVSEEELYGEDVENTPNDGR